MQAALLAVLCSVTGAVAPRYHVTVLPALPGGDYSAAMAINNHGVVVGLSSTGKELLHGLLRDTRAVIWQGERIRDLIGKKEFSPAAFAVNGRGDVLIGPQLIGGTGPGSVPAPEGYVVLWHGRVVRTWRQRDLFAPRAIDARGNLVGSSQDRASRMNGTRPTQLAIPYPNERAGLWAISDSGVAGGSYQHGDQTRGFVLASGRYFDPAPWAVEAFRGVTAISRNGTAAETARGSDWHTHLIVWNRKGTRDLAQLGRYGSVSGINDRGQIVGDRIGKPFLYSGGRLYTAAEITDRPDIEITQFAGMNESGQIAASGTFRNHYQALRLDPR